MKKTMLLTLALALLSCFRASAEVQFLPEATENLYIKSYVSASSDTERCRNAGYVYTSCEGALADPCPYHNGYYATCCPAGYTKQLSECTGNISIDNCRGFYKCDGTSAAEQRCLDEGYTSRSDNPYQCNQIPAGTYPSLQSCPYASGYYKCEYIELDMSYYCSHGYNQRCSECGPNDLVEICPYDSSYCSCTPQVIILDPIILEQN